MGRPPGSPTRFPPQTQCAIQAPLPGCSAPRLWPDNNFPKKTKEKKGVQAEPHPGAEKQLSRERGSVCGASPSLRPGNNSIKAPAAQLAASSRFPAAASRGLLMHGVPGRRTSSTRKVDRTPGIRLAVASRDPRSGAAEGHAPPSRPPPLPRARLAGRSQHHRRLPSTVRPRRAPPGPPRDDMQPAGRPGPARG